MSGAQYAHTTVTNEEDMVLTVVFVKVARGICQSGKSEWGLPAEWYRGRQLYMMSSCRMPKEWKPKAAMRKYLTGKMGIDWHSFSPQLISSGDTGATHWNSYTASSEEFHEKQWLQIFIADKPGRMNTQFSNFILHHRLFIKKKSSAHNVQNRKKWLN